MNTLFLRPSLFWILLSCALAIQISCQKNEEDESPDKGIDRENDSLAFEIQPSEGEPDTADTTAEAVEKPMDPLVKILSYRDMDKISPTDMGILDSGNIEFQTDENGSTELVLVGETYAYSIMVQFQKEKEDTAWMFDRTVIDVKGGNKYYARQLNRVMEQVLNIKAVESSWGSTESYTWEVSPRLIATINGFASPDTVIIKLQVNLSQIDET